MPSKTEIVVRKSKTEKNLRMWGHLYIDVLDRKIVGWIVNSWSENGEPYWYPKLHWLDRQDDKLRFAKLEVDFAIGSTHVLGEDSKIEPARDKFIRLTVAEWEQEWARTN